MNEVNREDEQQAIRDAVETALAAWTRTIWIERARQISKGYTAEHDAEHGVTHLLNWAIEYSRTGEAVKSSALILAALDLLNPTDPVLSPERGE